MVNKDYQLRAMGVFKSHGDVETVGDNPFQCPAVGPTDEDIELCRYIRRSDAVTFMSEVKSEYRNL